MATQVMRGNVILPDRVLERGMIAVEDGIIVAVVEDDARYTPTEDVGAHFIAPGFIDLHTHGIAGADTMDASEESLARMARRFAAHGVTGFLPTTVTQSLELTLDRAVANMVCLCAVPVHDAVFIASATSAAAIGLGDRKGQIAVGYDADVVVLTPKLRSVRTVFAGR